MRVFNSITPGVRWTSCTANHRGDSILRASDNEVLLENPIVAAVLLTHTHKTALD